MNVLSSLRSRIFLTSALLAVLSIGAAVYLVSVRVTREAEDAMRRDILATRAVVDQLRTTRAQTFTMMARLIADAPKLKAAVDTNDPPTVQDIANGYQTQLNSNLLFVTNRAGALLATVGTPPQTARAIAEQAAIHEATLGRESSSLLPQADGLLQLVTVPISIGLERPDILGTLSVGFLFDEALAQQLKHITGSEIAFGMNGEILSTTLPVDDRAALKALLQQVDRAETVMLRTGEYVALPLTLSAAGSAPDRTHPVALILRSRTEQLRFLRTIHTELGATAVLAVLLATLLSFAVARTITRPLAAITDVMKDVASTGDLTRKIVLGGGRGWEDEDARLLAATFNALTDSVARFQSEIAQRERLLSLGRLSTVIAHEVRNPLMIIKAALRTLRRQPAQAPALAEAVADIDGEVARLNRIVNDVLDFARPIRFELAPADLNALCSESALAAQAGPGPAVTLDLDPQVPSVVTDAERLRIALVNLIVNARQAVESDEPAAVGSAAGSSRTHATAADPLPVASVFVSTRIERRPDGAGDQIAIAVTDAGVGIDSANLSKVFDPYFTTKRGGTGLGLPIAKNIVEGLGGVITVWTGAGRGTTIRIHLPVTPAGSPS